jgi:hypothetical protein
MRTIAWLFVLCAILVVVRWFSSMTWQAASSGKMYYVKSGPDQRRIADHLDVLSEKLRALLDRADDMYPRDPRIANVRARWNGRLSETSGHGDIAYSMNKSDVYVCVRDPETGEIEPLNTSMYVLLHEIAHVATDTYGHPPEFWTNFRWFLEVAEKLGMYEYEDFDKAQVTFCGHALGNNVMRCLKEKRCTSLLPKK